MRVIKKFKKLSHYLPSDLLLKFTKNICGLINNFDWEKANIFVDSETNNDIILNLIAKH
jgi:hypothetical protein